MRIKHLLAAAALTLSLGAQALSFTAQAPAVALAPGGQALARFDVDFGDMPLELLALELHFDFDPALFAAGADSILLSFTGEHVPDLVNLGHIEFGNSGFGASYTWAALTGMPEVSGSGVFSIMLADNGGLLNPALLTARLLVSAADELDATASLSVVPAPVPEPATWALALAGGCLLIAVRRRVTA